MNDRLAGHLTTALDVPDSEQAGDVPVLGYVDLQRRGHLGQAGHRHDVTGDDDDEAGTCREAHVFDLDDVILRRPAQSGIRAQRVLCLRDADRGNTITFVGELLELARDLRRQVDVGSSVDPLCDRADLFFQRPVQLVALVLRRPSGLSEVRTICADFPP